MSDIKSDDDARFDARRDRRGSESSDNGERRRKNDIAERQEEFRLFRDKVLLTLGSVGLAGLALAAVFIGFKNEAIALTLATIFAGILGIPTALRLDERRSTNVDT